MSREGRDVDAFVCLLCPRRSEPASDPSERRERALDGAAGVAVFRAGSADAARSLADGNPAVKERLMAATLCPVRVSFQERREAEADSLPEERRDRSGLGGRR